MKATTITYWITTTIVAGMMILSGCMYFTSAAMEEFAKTGFPDFFRIELGIAKLLGALALLLPFIPARVKEWAYAGFGIIFISAGITHIAMGDPIGNRIGPFVFLAVLAVSNICYRKLHKSV